MLPTIYTTIIVSTYLTFISLTSTTYNYNKQQHEHPVHYIILTTIYPSSQTEKKGRKYKEQTFKSQRAYMRNKVHRYKARLINSSLLEIASTPARLNSVPMHLVSEWLHSTLLECILPTYNYSAATNSPRHRIM